MLISVYDLSSICFLLFCLHDCYHYLSLSYVLYKADEIITRMYAVELKVRATQSGTLCNL
jgi:hypothetical protein